MRDVLVSRDVRLVVLRGSPDVDRMLTPCSDESEIGDLDLGGPAVPVLLQQVEEEGAL